MMVTLTYTFSDVMKLPDELYWSLKSASRFFTKNEIVVYYTPPRSEETLKRIEHYCTVKLVPNISRTYKWLWMTHRCYEKTWIKLTDDEEVLFLDCDTLVLRNPKELFLKDFEVGVRKMMPYFDWKNWKKILDNKSLPFVWMPLCAVILFKHYMHKDICEEWLKYKDYEVPLQVHLNPRASRRADFYGLAFAIARKRILWLTKNEVVRPADKEYPKNAYVYHIQTPHWSERRVKELLKIYNITL